MNYDSLYPKAENYELPVLEICNLTLDFELEGKLIHAVKKLSLKVRRGEIVALVGESGSGKSATALTVMGIEDKNARIREGQIFLSGQEVLSMPKKRKMSYVTSKGGMIFQEPRDSLNPLLSIGYQLVEAVQIHHKHSYKEAYAQAVKQLELLSLPEPEKLMKKYPFMLSGGMCQRVMIAMATLSSPSLLIADEPTTALDVTVQKQILIQLDAMRNDKNMGILLITHDLGVVAEIADWVYIMKEGELVEEGDVFQIFEKPKHVYTKQLLDGLL